MLPCPPAETAEINQYDLTDALMDTERSHRDESTDPGTSESDCSIFVEYMAAVALEGERSEVCSMPSCCSQHVEVSLSLNNPKLQHCLSARISVLWIFSSVDMEMPQYMNVFEWKTWKGSKCGFLQKQKIVVLFCSIYLHFTFYLMSFMWPILVYKDLHRHKRLNICNHLNPFHISCFT